MTFLCCLWTSYRNTPLPEALGMITLSVPKRSPVTGNERFGAALPRGMARTSAIAVALSVTSISHNAVA